ncbi:hypothetical protein QQ045_010949 [Rhodiola kirilowii]
MNFKIRGTEELYFRRLTIKAASILFALVGFLKGLEFCIAIFLLPLNPRALGRSQLKQELWAEFNACLNIAANDIEKTEYIHDKLKEMRLHLQEVSAAEPVRCKSTIIGELIGASKPTEILVKPPAVVHTKGSGKRLESEFEKAINKPARAPRMCKFCLTLGTHD